MTRNESKQNNKTNQVIIIVIACHVSVIVFNPGDLYYLGYKKVIIIIIIIMLR